MTPLQRSLLTKNSSVGLDFLRAFCSQLVLVGHGISFVGIYLNLQPPHFPYMQNIAVVIFFLLSGFLITYSVFQKTTDPSYGFNEYFIDRFARIYSGYIPCLIFIFFFDTAYSYLSSEYYHQNAFNLKTFIGNIFMLQDYPKKLFGVTSFGSGRPLWTLAIEWWFYMFFGWLVLKLDWARKSKMNFLFFIVTLLVFAVVPVFNLKGRGQGLTLVWVFGSLSYFAFLYLKIIRISSNWALIGFLFFLASALTRSISRVEEYELVFAVLLAISIIFFVLFLDQTHFLVGHKIQRAITFFASFSFTLYMIHYSVMDFAAKYFYKILPGSQIFLLSFLASNVLAWILARFTEAHYKTFGYWLKKMWLTKRSVHHPR